MQVNGIKFQSLTGRLQTRLPDTGLAVQVRFNPSQVGYKPSPHAPTASSPCRFNPSQVGYKRSPCSVSNTVSNVSIPHR